jgi:hypothetical protein
LAEGLQNALWALGGAPAEHRSDSCQWRLNFRQIGRGKNRHFVACLIGECGRCFEAAWLVLAAKTAHKRRRHVAF